MDAGAAAMPRAFVRAMRGAGVVEPEPAMNVEPGPACGRSREKCAGMRMVTPSCWLGQRGMAWASVQGALAGLGFAGRDERAAARPAMRWTKPQDMRTGPPQGARGRAARRSAFDTIVSKKRKKVHTRTQHIAHNRNTIATRHNI